MKRSTIILCTGVTSCIVVLFSCLSYIPFLNNPQEPSTTATPGIMIDAIFAPIKLGTIDSDLPYCTIEDQKLLMDVYWPTEGSGPFPIVLYVHGGGWSGGDKTINIKQYTNEIVSRGIAIAAVNYRVAPAYKFPAMIEDVKCAVRHIRANATAYNIDPNHIGALGGSSGGHLVNLLGTTDSSVGWDNAGGYTNTSSGVTAVIDMYGPTDLRIESDGTSKSILKNVFGMRSYDVMGFASPITYVTHDSPPFLIFHGEDDVTVPISQSEIFVATLKAAEVDVTFVRVLHAGHSFAPSTPGVAPDPATPKIATQIGEWLTEHLK